VALTMLFYKFLTPGRDWHPFTKGGPAYVEQRHAALTILIA